MVCEIAGAYTQVINSLRQKRVGHMRLNSLCTVTVEDHKVLDTPVHVHVHAVTMHKWKIVMMVLITHVRQTVVLPMQTLYKVSLKSVVHL